MNWCFQPWMAETEQQPAPNSSVWACWTDSRHGQAHRYSWWENLQKYEMPADFIHYIILYCLVRAEEGVGIQLYETCNGSFFFNCFQFIWLRYWTVNKKSVGGEIRSKKLRGLNITTPTWDPLFLLLKTHFVTNQAKLSFIQKTKKMSMCSGNPLVCDCEMKWYKKWWEGDWQKIDTDHIKVRFKQKQKLQKYLI